MKLFVLACLVALCYAQPVPVEIPETFSSTVSEPLSAQIVEDNNI